MLGKLGVTIFEVLINFGEFSFISLLRTWKFFFIGFFRVMNIRKVRKIRGDDGEIFFQSNFIID